jgi:hypothetical protein
MLSQIRQGLSHYDRVNNRDSVDLACSLTHCEVGTEESFVRHGVSSSSLLTGILQLASIDALIGEFSAAVSCLKFMPCHARN